MIKTTLLRLIILVGGVLFNIHTLTSGFNLSSIVCGIFMGAILILSPG